MRLILVLLLVFVASDAMASRHGISGYSTANCSGCHAAIHPGHTTSSAGSQSVGILENANNSYLVQAGSTTSYTLRIASISTGDDYAGFDLSATGGLLSAGVDSKILNGEVTHSERKVISSNQVEWVFSWQAPATAGTYDLRSCGLTENYVSMDSIQFKYTPCVTRTITVNAAPVADAGVDQTVVEATAGVSLNGSASSDAAPGSISSYFWQQLSGPAVTLSNANAVSPTFTAPSVSSAGETLIFRLTVTDNQGTTAQDTVSIAVTYNSPPIANAGNGQSVLQNTAGVVLNGAASSDPGGSIASYAWVQTSGTAVSLSSASVASPTFTAPNNVGPSGVTLIFQLTVTDNRGKTAQATVNVEVYEPGNAPPVADAGVDQAVVEGAVGVALDGSASSDADGSISSYAWLQTAGTAVSLSNANVASPTFTAPAVSAAGSTLVFRLTVTDDSGATATDTVAITVNDPAPVVNAGVAINANEGDAFSLSATASDAGGTISSYLWQQLSGPAVTFSSTSILNPAVTLPAITASTVVQLELTVTDDAGQAQSATLNINISNINALPVAVISDSAGGAPASLLAGTHTTLYGNYSTDADGSIVSYAWVQTGGTDVCTLDPCVLTSNTLTFDVPSVPASELLSFQLTVTDADGATDTATISLAALDQLHVTTSGGELVYDIQTVAADAHVNSVEATNLALTSTSTANGPVTLPYGVTELLIDLTADPLAENGNAVFITLYLDRAEAADEYLYLYSNSGWTNLSDGLDFNNLTYTTLEGWYMPLDSAEFVAPGVLEIYVSDGGPLDTDGEVNGSITFTSGVGTAFQNGASGVISFYTLLLLPLLWLTRYCVVRFRPA